MKLFPQRPHKARSLYRKMCAGLNRKLGTVEVKMCGRESDADVSEQSHVGEA